MRGKATEMPSPVVGLAVEWGNNTQYLWTMWAIKLGASGRNSTRIQAVLSVSRGGRDTWLGDLLPPSTTLGGYCDTPMVASDVTNNSIGDMDGG